MLTAMIRLRPKRSISHPPASPNVPPHSAVIHSIRPIQSVTSGLFGGTFSNSAMAGTPASGVISSS